MVDWNEFDTKVDTKQLGEEAKQAESNTLGFPEVPAGKYEVKIEKLELGMSKKNQPMVKIWFNIINGQWSKCKIFMNQVVDNGLGIHKVNELLRNLNSGMAIEFNNYAQYNELILDIKELICEKEYELEYGENDKGYKTFNILQEFKKTEVKEDIKESKNNAENEDSQIDL